MRQYISTVIAERNILSPLCLFVMKSPINQAGASGKETRFFYTKTACSNGKQPLIAPTTAIFLTHLIFCFYLPLMFVMRAIHSSCHWKGLGFEISTFLDINDTRLLLACCHFSAQKSLDFRTQPLPMALVMESVKISMSLAI